VFFLAVMFAHPYTPAKNAILKERSVNAQSRSRRQSPDSGLSGWYQPTEGGDRRRNTLLFVTQLPSRAKQIASYLIREYIAMLFIAGWRYSVREDWQPFIAPLCNSHAPHSNDNTTIKPKNLLITSSPPYLSEQDTFSMFWSTNFLFMIYL
jgi:hypothetical protein